MSILRNLRLTSIQPGTIFIRNLDKAISPTGAPRLKAHRWKPKAVGFGGGVSLAIENLLKEDTFAKRGVTLRDIVSYTLHDRTHIGTTDNTDAFLITGCLVIHTLLTIPKGISRTTKGKVQWRFHPEGAHANTITTRRCLRNHLHGYLVATEYETLSRRGDWKSGTVVHYNIGAPGNDDYDDGGFWDDNGFIHYEDDEDGDWWKWDPEYN